MSTPSERLEILNRLDQGEITPEEAAQLLSAAPEMAEARPSTPMGVLEQLERGEISPDQAAEEISAAAEAKAAAKAERKARKHKHEHRHHARHWDDEASQTEVEVIPGKAEDPAAFWRWWMVPVGVGALMAALSGWWMAADLRDGVLGFGFLCAWFPMALGILLLVLGALNRRGPWANIHVRSRKSDGHVDFNMNLPVSIDLASKTLRYVGDRVPKLDPEDVDNLVDALEQASKSGSPIHIQANSDDGEDAVDISIS